MHLFMVVWGFLILVLHARATFWPRSQFWVYGVHSWFSSKTGCLVLTLNCSEFANVTGNMAELTDAFYGLDEHMLTTIKIRFCPYIEVPSTIQRFYQLEELMITNSTLARWDADATLTDKTNRRYRKCINAIGDEFDRYPFGTSLA